MTSIIPLAQRACAITGIAALVGGMPASASASTSPPIEIRACSPVFATDENTPYGAGLQLQSGVEIRFINRADVPAVQVAFRFGDGPDAATVVDRGTFAPGVTIRKVFETTPRTESVCRVAAVRFIDHTAYDATVSATPAF